MGYNLYSSLNSSNHQTTNDAYHGNWALIHVDRGHLNPNEEWLEKDTSLVTKNIHRDF